MAATTIPPGYNIPSDVSLKHLDPIPISRSADSPITSVGELSVVQPSILLNERIYNSIIEERSTLIEKKYYESISEKEHKRIAYLTWMKNRIERIQNENAAESAFSSTVKKQRTLLNEIQQLVNALQS